MTVASETSSVSYAGSGTTGPFTVPFPFIVGSDLKVRVIDAGGDITSIAGFTATGAGNPSGGAVTVPSPVPSGSEVEIYRDPPLTQTAAYTPNGSFPAKSHEQALDRLVMIDQRNRALIDETIEILTGFEADVASTAAAAVTASTQAGVATTKAGVATTQAATATTQADAATTARVAAENARDAALAAAVNKLDKTAGGTVAGLTEFTIRPTFGGAGLALSSEIVAGTFLGNWNASTNSPTLTASPGGGAPNGAYYIVSTAGTQSVTGSSVAFAVGDTLRSTGSAWQRIPSYVDKTTVGLGNVANKSEAQLVATGAVADALTDRAIWNHVPVDPRRYGADPTGVADSTAAIQACINANSVTQFGPGTYLVTGAVTVTTGRSVLGPIGGSGWALSIKTGTSTGGFILTGSAVLLRGLRFEARHAGNLIVNNSYNSAVRDCFFQDSYSGGSPQAMIYSDASGFWFKDNQLSTSRNAPSLMIDRNATRGLNIENHIYGNTWTGPGKGLSVGSSDTSARPEGIKIINNTFACNSRQLLVDCGLMVQLLGNTFDQGGDLPVYFYPGVLGIKNVTIQGNWIAGNNSGGVAGAGLGFITNGGSTTNVKVIGNEIGFATYGLYADDQAARFVVSGNTLLNTTIVSLYFAQTRQVIIRDNHWEGTVGQCMALIDGALGGPFVYGGNFFDAPSTRAMTDSGRFVNNGGNFGGSGY